MIIIPNSPIFFNTCIPKNFDKDESLLTILAMLILKLGVHRAVIPKYPPMHEGLYCAKFCADKYQKFPIVGFGLAENTGSLVKKKQLRVVFSLKIPWALSNKHRDLQEPVEP